MGLYIYHIILPYLYSQEVYKKECTVQCVTFQIYSKYNTYFRDRMLSSESYSNNFYLIRILFRCWFVTWYDTMTTKHSKKSLRIKMFYKSARGTEVSYSQTACAKIFNVSRKIICRIKNSCDIANLRLFSTNKKNMTRYYTFQRLNTIIIYQVYNRYILIYQVSGI